MLSLNKQMFRMFMLVAVYVLLVITTYSQFVLGTDREYQHIEHIQRSGVINSNEYIITNESNETAVFTLGYYVHTADHVRFPYRLIHQHSSQTLRAGESIVVDPDQFSATYSELPDTLVINSTGTLAVTYDGDSSATSASDSTWLPRNAKSIVQAFSR